MGREAVTCSKGHSEAPVNAVRALVRNHWGAQIYCTGVSWNEYVSVEDDI